MGVVSLVHVVKYCASEVERQEATIAHVPHMFSAWDYALTRSLSRNAPDEKDLIKLAYFVDPEINNMRIDTNYRITPAIIVGGKDTSKPAHIPRNMSRWEDCVGTGLEYESTVDSAVTWLLEIHPWADGNGRVASIVRNWMCGTLLNPTPLPYYFGQH